MTFAGLRALHAIIGDAIDDIERIYAVQESSSPTSSPGVSESTSIHKAGDAQEWPSNSFLRESPGFLSREHPPKTPQHAIIPPAMSLTSRTVESEAYASPPPTPCVTTHPEFPLTPGTQPTTPGRVPAPDSERPPLDFPCLDSIFDPTSPAEVLASRPDVVNGINRIVAAAGQLAATVQNPFLTLCDASMGYHLPSCMRLLEASHTVEILREAGNDGMHVNELSHRNGVDKGKLAHILRLLCTHHIMRELSPDVFALNRISSLVDSGKSFNDLRKWEDESRPEMKYHGTNGIAAFVGMCTDELQKSSAYLTEAYLLSPSRRTREARDPSRAPFCYAFGTMDQSAPELSSEGPSDGIGFFGWLEGEGAWRLRGSRSTETGLGAVYAPARGLGKADDSGVKSKYAQKSDSDQPPSPDSNPNRFRLERFGKAMSGTGNWEAPGAVLNGFDWHSLPPGSVVVDVGGGIGSTSMLLATAFSSPESGGSDSLDLGLKFVIQDRGIVTEMGKQAWKMKFPRLLESGIARFQVHDFFAPQPVRNAAVFLLRVILHDWPDAFAQRILSRLREAATPDTKLIIADFVLPLACRDDFSGPDPSADVLRGVAGRESPIPPSPLLANLGKASANVYWMDLTMQVTFNGQERTLREISALALSAGWKVVKVTKPPGSSFGHIVAVPIPVPSPQDEAVDVASSIARMKETQMLDSASSLSRCGTPTFGSRTDFSSVDQAMAARFPHSTLRSRAMILDKAKQKSAVPQISGGERPSALKSSVNLFSSIRKKPSPLSTTSPTSPTPAIPQILLTPRQTQPSMLIRRRFSQAPVPQFSLTPSSSGNSPAKPSPPLHSTRQPTISRRASIANLTRINSISTSPIPPVPQIPRVSPGQNARPSSNTTSPIPPRPLAMKRRASYAQIPKGGALTFRSTSPVPPVPPLQSVAASSGLASPIVPRSTLRSSQSRLPRSGGLRSRSGSMINGSIAAATGMLGFLPRGGGVLRFDSVEHKRTGSPSKKTPTPPLVNDTQDRGEGEEGYERTVLAAAAKIEKAASRMPSQ